MASLRRRLARSMAGGIAAWLLWAGIAWAQGTPALPPRRPPEPKPAEPGNTSMKPGDFLKQPTDPVVAMVEGHPIYFSDIGRAVPTLPETLRNLPFEILFPVVLDRLIDEQALVAVARRRDLDEDPAVQRDMQAAADRVLENALLAREAAPGLIEEKLRLRYARQFAGRPASEETRARHILVTSEAEAKRLIADLNKGADFATLARQYSKDPDRDSGGDLGFFRRDQVWPDFADMAFMLQPGQISQTPIRNEFGWHILKVEERRQIAPPSYPEMRDRLREAVMEEATQRAIGEARAQLSIRKFNLDGTPMAAVPDITPQQPMVRPQEGSARP